MSAGAVIALVIILALIAIVVTVAGTTILRRMALRRRFGAEYDQLASRIGPRRAHAELAERQRRVEELNLKPLTAEKQAGYGREWTAVQERFVDSPAQATRAAAALVTAVAADCGYSVSDQDRFLTDLSVYHSPRLAEYRRARETTERAGAPTEDLRQALLGYRAMFLDLLWAPDNAVDRPGVPANADSATSAGTNTAATDMAGSGAATSEYAAADGADDRTMAWPTRKG